MSCENGDRHRTGRQVRTWPKGDQDRFVQVMDAHIQAVGDTDEQGMVTVKGEAARYGNWFTVAEGENYQVQRRNNAGMFGRSLGQNPDIALRVNHETALARTQAGTLKVWETQDALLFEGKVNTRTQAGNDIVQNMRDGLVTQGSVMYWPVEMETWEEVSEDKTIVFQDIRQGKIDKGDVSLVIWGANPQCQTTVAQMAQMKQPAPTPAAAVPRVSVNVDVGEQAAPVETPEPPVPVGQVAVAALVAEPEPVAEPAPDDDLLIQKERAKVRFQYSLSADPVTRRYGV